MLSAMQKKKVYYKIKSTHDIRSLKIRCADNSAYVGHHQSIRTQMYISNDDTQNYLLCRLQSMVETFGQPNLIKTKTKL